MYLQVISLAMVVSLTVGAVSRHNPCPFPSRVCQNPEKFFGSWLKPGNIFTDGFSSVLYTMNEKPLLEKRTEKVILRVVIWPSFDTPTMSRFEISKGTVVALTKKLHFTSRTSLPDVMTSRIWKEADNPVLVNELSLLKDRNPKAEPVAEPGTVMLAEDGTAILVEVLEPGKRYRAYHFQDFQDPKLYRDILDVTTPPS